MADMNAKSDYEAALVEQIGQLSETIGVLSEAVRESPLVVGSRKQPVVNPAARELAGLHRTKADLERKLLSCRNPFMRV
ncbi:hypothetical protein I6H48_04355 [Corynebacterium amycolatum]|uniref:Uncharacterized protein n=1 Tax=Corynebacterium amycolatum TaxID=43765 RepID=A0AB37GDT0_CORAY|nr:hypothetical protein [Corynebacterium amycolatum]QPR31566.1 hypothetical protein I6G95_03775 [Corynebacterium amycolatum]QQB83446.1 hypothetical protein I6H48_04355 [Corynebacterium amycolatum]